MTTIRKRQSAAKSRHQPPRKCKRQEKFNWELLPDDMIVEILAWSAPKMPCLEGCQGWKWFGTISSTCKKLRALAAEHLIPQAVRVSGDDICDLSPTMVTPFLRSFINTKLRGEMLTRLEFVEGCAPHYSFMPRGSSYVVNNALFDNLRTILTVKDVAPKLTSVCIDMQASRRFSDSMQASRRFSDSSEFNLIRPGFFRDLSMSLPRIRSLKLFCFSKQAITAEEMAGFAAAVGASLEELVLGDLEWLSDKHLHGMIPHMTALSTLQLQCFPLIRTNLEALRDYPLIPDDFGLASVRWQGIKRFSFRGPLLPMELESVFRGCQLRELDLSHSKSFEGLAEVIAENGINLTCLKADACSWMTDGCISSIIDAQMEAHCETDIPLRSLGVSESAITPAGLREVLEKAPGLGASRGHGDPGFIKIGWEGFSPEGIDRMEKMILRTEDASFVETLESMVNVMKRLLETWRPLVTAFPHIKFM